MSPISLSTPVTYWLSLLRTPTTLTLLSFTLLGLLNNILYVLLLSAAQDLVGPTTPKSLVLLADVLPSFMMKLLAPYFIHHISYPVRILCLILLSSGGMLVVSLTPTDASLAKKMSGVILASLSSGAGELSFLGLTSFYGPGALAGWGSGTGIAGLAGAGLYVVMTDWWGLTVRRTLLVSATFPLGMAFAFFWLLPPPLVAKAAEYRAIDTEEEEVVNKDVEEVDTEDVTIADNDDSERDIEGFSDEARGFVAGVDAYKNSPATFARRIAMIRLLFFPYMLPLFLVYVAEYTINQGVAPVLLFPLESSPFSSFREFYPMYGFLYQLGVFISRSSTPFVRLRRLYPPSLLQCVNLALLVAQAMFFVLPSVYVVFLVIFWEGLLGGAVYVNTFAAIMEEVAKEQHEFSLGATSVSDSAGICVAGFVGMGLEMALCGWQVGRGRDWCRNVKVLRA